MLVIGGTANQILADIEGKTAVLFEPADHLADLGHDLGANAVAGQNQQGIARHRRHPHMLMTVATPPSLAVPLRQVHGELGCVCVADRAG